MFFALYNFKNILYFSSRIFSHRVCIIIIVRYMAAKAVYKERKPMWDGINPNFLARPPRGQTLGGVAMVGGARGKERKREEMQMTQFRLWKRRLAYERSNPEVHVVVLIWYLMCCSLVVAADCKSGYGKWCVLISYHSWTGKSRISQDVRNWHHTAAREGYMKPLKR